MGDAQFLIQDTCCTVGLLRLMPGQRLQIKVKNNLALCFSFCREVHWLQWQITIRRGSLSLKSKKPMRSEQRERFGSSHGQYKHWCNQSQPWKASKDRSLCQGSCIKDVGGWQTLESSNRIQSEEQLFHHLLKGLEQFKPCTCSRQSSMET